MDPGMQDPRDSYFGCDASHSDTQVSEFCMQGVCDVDCRTYLIKDGSWDGQCTASVGSIHKS